MPCLTTFLIGLLIGSFFGVFAMAFIVSAGRGDNYD